MEGRPVAQDTECLYSAYTKRSWSLTGAPRCSSKINTLGFSRMDCISSFEMVFHDMG